MGGGSSRLDAGFFYWDTGLFEYVGEWSNAQATEGNARTDYTFSNAAFSNASIAFTVPSDALGYCLYTVLPLPSPLPTMQLHFAGQTFDIPANFNVSTILTKDNPLLQEFRENVDSILPIYCRNTASSVNQVMMLNQTTAGSISFRGLGAWQRVDTFGGLQNSSAIAGVAIAVLAALLFVITFSCLVSRKVKQKKQNAWLEQARAERGQNGIVANDSSRQSFPLYGVPTGNGGEGQGVPANESLWSTLGVNRRNSESGDPPPPTYEEARKTPRVT